MSHHSRDKSLTELTDMGGHVVCPGDWIITGIAGEHYPCKPDIFKATYDPVQPKPHTEGE